jgi:hypothetical protein
VGPHPKRRILSLPTPPIAKSPIPAASLATPTQTAAKGPETAAGSVRVGEDPKARHPGPASPRGPAQGPSDAATARIAVSRARRIARDAAMAWLAATYPAAFGLDGDVKPVAIGVGKLIWPEAKAAGIKRRALHDALSRRAGSIAYLEALVVDGVMRIGLDGAVVEAVSIEHQVLALNRLAEIERRLERHLADAR